MCNLKMNGCNAGHAAPVKIKPNNAPNSIANTIYTVELLAATFKSVKAVPSSMRRVVDFLPYRLETTDDGFFIARTNSYMNLGSAGNYKARQDHEFMKIPPCGVDVYLLLPNNYFYKRTSGPFMGRPSHCREYLFRLWWTFRKIGLPPPLSYDQMIIEASKLRFKREQMVEVREYCHEL